MMIFNRLIPFSLLLMLVLATTACNTLKIKQEIPPSFALYAKESTAIRMITAEGVMYRVRSVENNPKADLAFWQKAIKTHMLDSGYVFQSESEIAARDQNGYLLNLAAPVGASDYLYSIALFVHNKSIILIESAGEIAAYDKQSKHIRSLINNTDIARIAQ